MAPVGLEDAISDIQVGFTRTLAMICNQLIDQRILDRELLIADLAQVQLALGERKVGLIGLAIPAALASALRQNAAEQP